MSDIREKLARAILVNAMCPGQEYIATRVADAILAEFLVVPRADVTTKYGWQYFHNGRWQTIETENRQQAVDNAAYQRDTEGSDWPTPARAVQHLTTSWSPIPLPEGDSQ